MRDQGSKEDLNQAGTGRNDDTFLEAGVGSSFLPGSLDMWSCTIQADGPRAANKKLT